jgi:hypothetical protein
MTDHYLQFLSEAKKAPATTPTKASTKSPYAAPKMPERPSFIKPVTSKSDRSMYKQLSDIIAKAGSNSDVNYTNEGLVEMDYNGLNLALNVLDELPSSRNLGYSAIIYGEAGIGKSAIFSQRGKARAAALGRTFIEMTDLLKANPTIDKLEKALKTHFVYINVAASTIDPTLLSGIPDPTSPEKKGYLTELPVPWVAIMTMSPDSAGFLFFDELNQANQDVQNTLFDITNFDERTIARKYTIQGDWRIHCAGNWGEGYSIIDLVPALKERLAPYLLKLDFEGWAKWAEKSKMPGTDNPIIHPILMDFISDDPDVNFYDRPAQEGDPTKRPNPRNLVATSGAIYRVIGSKDSFNNITKDQWFELQASVSSICGKQFGEDFKQFVIANSLIDVAEILSKPEMLVKGPGVNESQVTQNLSVFKSNLRNFVKKFDDSFTAAKTEEAKADLVDTGLAYLFVINSIYTVEPNTASILFSAIANKAMMDDLKLFRSHIVSTLKSADNTEGVTWVINMINEIITDVTGNARAFAGEDEEEAEDIAVPAMSPEAAKKINDILNKFNSQLKSGTLPNYV